VHPVPPLQGGPDAALALSLAKLTSPGELFAFGLRDDELALARRLGADSAVNGADDRGGLLPPGLYGRSLRPSSALVPRARRRSVILK
jgi:hypothetical protein